MANTTEREDGEMDVNSPEQMNEEMPVSVRGSNMPCQVDKQLDFLAFNTAGRMLMGSSSLSGRYWGGSLWWYDDPSHAPSIDKAVTGHDVNSGVVEAAFINDDSFVVAEDIGTVEFLVVKEVGGDTVVQSVCQIEEHQDTVHCVRVTAGQKTLLTSSADMSIRLWDCHTSAMVRILSTAHSQAVTCVAPHPSNDQVFLSAGLDGNVLLWDLRLQKPASCVYRDCEDKPLCVAWTGEGESGGQAYVVGLESGTLALRNTAHLSYTTHSFLALNRPLYRMAVNPERPNQIAVCGNDSKLLVVDVDSEVIKGRYEDDRHSDFVRGLAWQDADTLYSCGWDKKVHRHAVPQG